MAMKPLELADESLDLPSPDTPGVGVSVRSVKRTKRIPTFTSTPDIPAPRLLCPTCDAPLAYRETVISGVKPIERWDYFQCPACGQYVYRERTRTLRPAI